MLAEYRQTNAEIGGLKAYNDQLAEQVKSQETEMATMTRQLGEIETTSREVLPMMQKMVTTLDDFVKLDMPFLPEERTNRIAALKDMMTRADVSISEKYRRIVEAYQIEIEYGRTIEAYQGKVDDKHRGLPARRPRGAPVPDARRQGDRLLGRGRSKWVAG